MNIVDQIYFGLVYVWSSLDKLIMGAAATAFVVALLRTRKRDGKASWIEATLCGIFATIALIGFSFIAPILVGILAGMGITINLPVDPSAGVAGIIAGFIGWYGTERTIEFVEDNLGGSKDETN